jgi:hypothetical protein
MKKESVRTNSCYYILTFVRGKGGNDVPRVDRVRIDQKCNLCCLVCNMSGDGMEFYVNYTDLYSRKDLRKVVEERLKDFLKKYKRIIKDTQTVVDAFGEQLDRIDVLHKG